MSVNKEVVSTKSVEDTGKETEKSSIYDDELLEDCSPVVYEVWGIGYAEDGVITDTEILFDSFACPDRAVEFAKSINLSEVVKLYKQRFGKALSAEAAEYLSIEVETVYKDEDSTMNAGTIYKRELRLNAGDAALADGEYAVTEDGLLEVPCDRLPEFDVNEIVRVWFVNETNADMGKMMLFYRIVSRVIKDNIAYFHCDFYEC